MSEIGRPISGVGQILWWGAWLFGDDGFHWSPSPSGSGQVLTWSGTEVTWASPSSSLVGLTSTAVTYLGVGATASTQGTAIGLYARASGTYSTVLGYYAGYSHSGYYATAIGNQALYSSCSGYYNTGVGYRAGYGINNTAAENTFVGAYSGSSAAWCFYNTLVGYNTQLAASNNTYAIVIGHSVTGKGTQTTVIGKPAGTGATLDTWLRGNTLRVGNEDATDKYLLFQRNSTANTVQPGFWWDYSATKLFWSHDGSTWNEFSTGGGTLAGDVTGAAGANTVVKIQNRAVASTAPADAQVMAWDATSSTWKPTTPAAPSLAITQVTMEKVVPGVGVTPGWEVLGAFVYNGAAAKLQAMVLVSMAGLTASVRLYGPTGGAAIPVPGSTITSTSLVEEVIESVELTSALTLGETYQFQMECTGGGAVTDFAVARSVALVAA